MTNDPNKNQDQEEKEKTGFSWKRIKGNATVAALVCAILFLILYAIININSFNSLISSVLSVLTPILLGGAIAYLLNPLLRFFEFVVFKKIKSKNVLRALSLLMTYVTAILVLVGFLFLLIPQLIESVTDFLGKLDGYLSTTATFINDTYSKIVGDGAYHEIVDADKIIDVVGDFVSGNESLMDNVKKYGAELFTAVKNIVLALFISIYVLISKERLKAQTKKLTSAFFSESANFRFYRYLEICHKTFSNFFVGKIIDSLIIGAITLVTLLIFRIPYPLLVASIICITNIIPVFGPIIGAVPCFLIIFIQDPLKALIFLVLILLIQQLDGNVIGPKILGDSTGLSSLGVIISIVIMSSYFGVVGMILGVPIFAVIVTIIKELIEDKLHQKELPTDTAEYYEEDSLVDPREKHESLFLRILHPLAGLYKKLVSLIRKLIKKIRKKD